MPRLIVIALLAAQTVITPPKNNYSPQEDLKLGQQAAAEAQRELPWLRDAAIGSAVAETTRFGLGTAFLRFGREFEKQADIEGSHIMARAGYDPRDMANMFKTIEKQGGSGGPQWLSDHPNPGDRSEYITREAQLLRVENPIRDTRAFEQVKGHLRQLSPAPTTEQATRNR